jgi:hypothetical protein
MILTYTGHTPDKIFYYKIIVLCWLRAVEACFFKYVHISIIPHSQRFEYPGIYAKALMALQHHKDR